MIEITFVGMYADTSPSSVSMIGSAVSEPPESATLAILWPGNSWQVVLGLALARHLARADVDLPSSPGPRRSVGFDRLLMPQSALDLGVVGIVRQR